jgi:hypothetical protein
MDPLAPAHGARDLQDYLAGRGRRRRRHGGRNGLLQVPHLLAQRYRHHPFHLGQRALDSGGHARETEPARREQPQRQPERLLVCEHQRR